LANRLKKRDAKPESKAVGTNSAKMWHPVLLFFGLMLF